MMARSRHINGENPVDVLLKPSISLDELLDIASRFDSGEIQLSSAACLLLLCMLEERAAILLGRGDEVRQLGVSLKRTADGAVCVVFKSRNLNDYIETNKDDRNCA